jgi:hypothetical protein
MSDSASIWEKDLEKFQKYLTSVNYRGFFSFESFFDGKTNHYIDMTCRSPLPLGLLYPTFAGNFAKLIYDIADGTAENSGFELGTFIGGAEVECENAMTEWLPLTTGKNTRLMRYMMQDGQAFSVPGGEATVAMVCGKGSSMEEVEQAIKTEAEELNIFFSKCSTDYLEKVRKDYLEPLKELGFDFDQLTGSSGLKPVTKEGPKDRQGHPVERRESVTQRKAIIQERSAETSADPLDEIRDMMESIGKPSTVKRPTQTRVPDPVPRSNEPKKGSVFAQPVDKYGIPI